ncbi:DNA-binding protein RFX7-like [Gadus chalcogrammus]|uniref:DNA-binding protein RFX7-like n=1 Tax=Gadus chalcogrammus TaxID=1042646 RepID=UPI0024C47FF8|nr:DNA-binding protein RFX7-like [Gadus chalcogrammus]
MDEDLPRNGLHHDPDPGVSLPPLDPGQHHDPGVTLPPLDPGVTLPSLGHTGIPLPPLVPGLQGCEASALQLRIKNSISKSVQSKVDTMLQDVDKFTDIEKLYLYLKLPTGSSVTTDKSEQALATSSRTQQTHAFHWIRSHLEEHPETSLPKQEVYDEYKSYCDNLNYHPLSAADFGKMMKNVFPNMKARRLGMRGKSKYCYSGLRKRALVSMPSLPTLDLHKTGNSLQFEALDSPGPISNIKEEVRYAACGLVCEWAQKVLSRPFNAVEDLARFLLNSHYISNKSVAALSIMASTAAGVKSPQSASAFVPTPEAGPYQPQAAARPSPSIDAKQQLQRKIHMKQQEQRLTSPPPGEGSARRAEEGAPPAGRALLGARPAHPSPQPPLGLVVAAVQSPLTVQRGRSLLSPSPAAENKVGPLSLQVVAPPVQSPRAAPADRGARQRYPQILPKPSTTSALALHPPPTVLLAGSALQAVLPACHLSPGPLLQMTAVPLPRGGAPAPPTPAPQHGTAEENQGASPQNTRGSAAPPTAPAVGPGPADQPPSIDVEMEVEVIHQNSQHLNANGLALNPGTVTPRGQPRAASVPIPQTRGYLGLEDRSYRKTSVTCSLGTITGTILEGGNNIINNQSTLHSNVSTRNLGDVSVPNANMSPSLRRSSDGLLFSNNNTTSPRKRTGLSPDPHYSPLKRVFTSRPAEGYSDDFRDEITAMTSRPPSTGVPLRPESAPVFSRGLMRGGSAVSPHGPALSTAPFNTSGFQTVARTQSTVEQRSRSTCSFMESPPSFGRGALIRKQQQYHMTHVEAISNSPDLHRQTPVSNNNPLCSTEGLSGPHMEQPYCRMDPLSDHQRTSTPLRDPLSAMGQPPACGPAAMQTGAGYFLEDDDVTQDSIVEELVQMEEQMKLNLQQFGPCASSQRQQTPMQGRAASSNQVVTPFYHSRNSSCTPVQTPTPTPTSEMMGGARALMSPCSRMAPTTPVDGALGGGCHTPRGTPTPTCSSTAQAGLVECRNPFAFTPINSSVTGYHGSSTVSCSPVKPMQRPTATHPDKAKLEWMNESYNCSAQSHSGLGLIPSYQDLAEDHFQKPHAFAIPGQTVHPQGRHHHGHLGRLTPVSPVQQQAPSMARREGFAVPAPLDNKATGAPAANTAFRCRSVSPAVGQRNTGTNGPPHMARTLVSPQFHSPVAPEMLNIFANSHQNMSVSSLAQRSQSVPVNVMMQTEVLPLQGQHQSLGSILLGKIELDCDTGRGLGRTHLPSSYTACMNLSQMVEPAPTGANHQALRSADNHSDYRFQKPTYLTQGPTNEQMMLCSGGGANPSGISRQYHQQAPPPHLTAAPPEQRQQQQGQLLDFNTTVKKLISENSCLHSGKRLSEQASEHSTGGQEYPGEMGTTLDLSSTISDLNTLDTNLLFDPNQQQGQYQDTTPEDIMNDPLFQQICSETANASGFDWLESKDHPTVGLIG